MIRKLLKDNKGEATYLSMAVTMIVIIIFIAFLLSMFTLLVAKIQLDGLTNEVVKHIQLNGGETLETLDFIDALDDANDNFTITWYRLDGEEIDNIPSDYISAFQLGEEFTVEFKARVNFGLGADFGLTPTITSYGIGISEKYWKE